MGSCHFSETRRKQYRQTQARLRTSEEAVTARAHRGLTVNGTHSPDAHPPTPSAAQRTEGRGLRWGVGGGAGAQAAEPKREPAACSLHSGVTSAHFSPHARLRGAPPPRRSPGCSQAAVPGPREGVEVGA